MQEVAEALLANPANASPLLRFAARHDVAVDSFDVPGGYVAMTNIKPFQGEDAQTTAAGKGFSAARAVLSCLGEAAEISSWACRTDDLDKAVRSPVSGPAIDARHVLGFSPAQIAKRDRLNRAWHGWDAIPPPDRLDDPRHWVEVRSFDGLDATLCPAFLCYGRYGDLAAGDSSLNVDSNGCAAGSTPAQARERAVLELVERDATGLWWHGRAVRRRLDAARFAGLEPRLRQHRHDTGRRLWLLDVSSFRTARTVAAISCEDSGERMALGFGAGFSLEKAARSAFLEAVQSEVAMEAHDMRVESAGRDVSNEGDCRMARWKRFADVRNFRFAIGTPPEGRDDGIAGNLPDLLTEIRDACGGKVWFADLTRADIGIPVAKAICGGLSHYKPRWGCPRNAQLQPAATAGGGRLSQARKLLI